MSFSYNRNHDRRGATGSPRALLALLSCCMATAAIAQNYPARTVRIIVPFVAGGPGDTVGRMVAPSLAEVWGQQVVIDNRAKVVKAAGVKPEN